MILFDYGGVALSPIWQCKQIRSYLCSQLSMPTQALCVVLVQGRHIQVIHKVDQLQLARRSIQLSGLAGECRSIVAAVVKLQRISSISQFI